MQLEKAWAVIRQRVETEINRSSLSADREKNKELADAFISIAEKVVAALITKR